MKKKRMVLMLLILAGFTLSSCEKNKECNVDNPLTALTWLKEIVDTFEINAVWFGTNPQAKIYQCRYKDGTGFLLEMCAGCPDAVYSFLNCEGVVLCSGGGFDGKDDCLNFKIKEKNKKLIWSKEKNKN